MSHSDRSPSSAVDEGLDLIERGLRAIASGVLAAAEDARDLVDDFVADVGDRIAQADVEPRSTEKAESKTSPIVNEDPPATSTGKVVSMTSPVAEKLIKAARSDSALLLPTPTIKRLQDAVDEAKGGFVELYPQDIVAALSPIPKEKMGSSVLRIYATALDCLS